MNRIVPSILKIMVLGWCWMPLAEAVEILRWERLPLSLPLMVGQERVVFVDRNLRIGIPSDLSQRLRVQTAGGAIYLRASAPIEPTRLQLQDINSGALILVDVSAQPASPGQTPLAPIRIIEGEPPPKESVDAPEALATEEAPPPPGDSTETPIPVVLVRYAAQSLYAPLRTVEPIEGLTRISLRRNLDLTFLLPSLPVQATALAAWRLNDYWVTAIRLINTTSGHLNLDPRALQGDFVAASFQHVDLGPVRDSTDTTVVYMVTRGRGLAEALLPAVSPIDASLNMSPTFVGKRRP